MDGGSSLQRFIQVRKHCWDSFGQPLFRSDTGGSAQLTPTGDNRATPYHLEAYYRFQVSDNISITPGAFVLFNPEGNSNNETTTVGVLRTTFTF